MYTLVNCSDIHCEWYHNLVQGTTTKDVQCSALQKNLGPIFLYIKVCYVLASRYAILIGLPNAISPNVWFVAYEPLDPNWKMYVITDLSSQDFLKLFYSQTQLFCFFLHLVVWPRPSILFWCFFRTTCNLFTSGLGSSASLKFNWLRH